MVGSMGCLWWGSSSDYFYVVVFHVQRILPPLKVGAFSWHLIHWCWFVWPHLSKKTKKECYYVDNSMCRAPLQKGCPTHHGHKGDLRMTPGTCGAGGEKAQVILVWVRTLGVGNASHPPRLGFMRVRPWAMHSSWHEDFKMLKNTSFGGVS